MALLLALSVSACNRSDDDMDMVDIDDDASTSGIDQEDETDLDDQEMTIDQMVKVDSPVAEATITNPVKISGKAVGSMYFEGTFPITIEDFSGKVIGTGQAKVTDDANWMTEDWVEFTADVAFTKPAAGTTGYIVLKKDNPSGEADNEMSLQIPVKF